MGLPDAELKIVSLVRYVDACDPAHRHRDCPYAVERDGTLSCREECREVLASALGHARAATPASRTFDARGLLLGETGPTPHVLWHTSSLLQVLVDVAQTHPLLDDGTLNLRRLVDATSALGALGCRGLDPDRVVRRGIAETMKLTLAGWLERLEFSDEPQGNGEHAAQWRAFFRGNADEALSPGGIAGAESLKREYRYLTGAWSPGLPPALLEERELSREDVATALADRAVADGDAIDPATMNSLTGQAAFDACELAYTTASRAGTVYLWVQGGDGWSVENTDVRRWTAHLGAELERSRGANGRWAAEAGPRHRVRNAFRRSFISRNRWRGSVGDGSNSALRM